MRTWLIKKLGGYTKGEALDEAVKELYNTIGADDILKEMKGTLYYKGKRMNAAFQKNIASEAGFLKNSKLWKVLETDIKYHSNKKMFLDSKTTNDIIAGKLMLYILDIINTRLKSLEKGSGRFNSDAR